MLKGDFFYNEYLKKYALKDIEEIYDEFNFFNKDLDRFQSKHIKKEKYIKLNNFFILLQNAFINPFNMILIVLVFISIFIENHLNRSITPSIFIITLLIIGGTIRLVRELKSTFFIKINTSEFTNEVLIKKNKRYFKVKNKNLSLGDVIVFSFGDKIPADVRIIKAKNLLISESILTGESTIVEKNSQKFIENKDSISINNIAFMGTSVVSGYGEGIVLATGENTIYGKYIKSLQIQEKKIENGINLVTFILIKFLLFLTPTVFIISSVIKKDLSEALLFAISIAIGLTPEMLPIIISVCLIKGNISMGKKQTIIKDVNIMENFGSMDILCVDKTGTLTGDKLILEYYTDILGNESLETLEFAYLNSFYYSNSKNHLDEAILKVGDIPNKKQYFKDLIKKFKKLDEVPFDYKRKFVSILFSEQEKQLLIIKGNPEKVYKRCKYIKYKNKIHKIDPNDSKGVQYVINEMLEDGMQVIAVAYKNISNKKISINDEKDLILIGYVIFFDAPKKSASIAVKKLRNLHINIKLLTGDQKNIANSICNRLGITSNHIITGEEIEKLSGDDLLIAVEKNNIFTDLTPLQKEMIVKTLQNNGHVVGFLGDGINDLAAIRKANVGISVNSAVKEVKQIADVVILKKDLEVLEKGILEGRKAYININKYIKITFSSNFGNIISIGIASIFLPFIPITATQILILNLIYDMLCLIFPWDNIDEDVSIFPQTWSVKKITNFMFFFGPISSIFDIITFLFLYYIFCPYIYGGMFNEISLITQENFISLFQSCWFLESLWTQTMIIQILKNKKINFIKNQFPFFVFTTLLLILISSICFWYKPLSGWLNMTSIPSLYFIFLFFVLVVYMTIISIAKIYYIKKYKRLYN